MKTTASIRTVYDQCSRWARRHGKNPEETTWPPRSTRSNTLGARRRYSTVLGSIETLGLRTTRCGWIFEQLQENKQSVLMTFDAVRCSAARLTTLRSDIGSRTRGYW